MRAETEPSPGGTEAAQTCGQNNTAKVLAENEQGPMSDKEETFSKYIILGVHSPALVDKPSDVTSQS